MDFSWSEQQLKTKTETAEFAKNLIQHDIIEDDLNSRFPKEGWKKCAEYGIQGMASVQAYGGATEYLDILTAMLAMEGFGYGCKDNGLAFALNAQMWTVQLPILQFGTEHQKKHFLEPMVKGSFIGSHAMTEPEHGSDVYSMKTHAKKAEGGYILQGEKCMITLAPVADLFLVFASTKPELGKWGLSAFIVHKDSQGLTVGKNELKMGMRTVPFGKLLFEDCFVPEENLLGKEGMGFSISNHSLEYERCSILASQLGAMERQLETGIDYARNRKQFGKPIGKYQSVSNRIAEMKLRLETARLLLYKVAWLKQNNKPAMMEAALLKLYLSESFIESSLDNIRIHGGSGYISENGIERDLRDAIGGILYAGTSDIQKNIISGLLGL